MDTDTIEQRLLALEAKIDVTYSAVEKMRKYMLITAWVTIGAVLLPILGLMFVIPTVISTYASALGGL